MRIVSYNVRYFGHGLKGLASTATSKARIAKALLSLTPAADIIALQEVETRSLRSRVAHQGTHPEETQLDAFLRHLEQEARQRGVPMPYRAWYYPAHVYRVGPVKLYTTGLAMLVNVGRLHVRSDNGAAPHRVTHHGSRRFQAAKQTRIAAHLHLEDPRGRPFHVFNTHLSLPTPFAREFWREERRFGFGKNQLAEARAVAEYAERTSRGEPYLLVGDLNSAPASPVYRYLSSEARLRGAQDMLRQIDPQQAEGFPTAGFLNLRMHLDHIFGKTVVFTDLRDTRPFGDPQSPFHGLSDHVPLIARFALE